MKTEVGIRKYTDRQVIVIAGVTAVGAFLFLGAFMWFTRNLF